MTLGGVRKTAILTNERAALELVSGGHLNASPVPTVDPDRLTCGVRVLALFPSPPRPRIEPGAETLENLRVTRSSGEGESWA